MTSPQGNLLTRGPERKLEKNVTTKTTTTATTTPAPSGPFSMILPPSPVGGISVSKIAIKNGQLVIKGKSLFNVKKVMIRGNSVSETLVKISASSTEYVADVGAALRLVAGKVYDVIISDAHGATTFPIEIELEDGSIGAEKLMPLSASEDGYVLKWDDSRGQWVAAPDDVGDGEGGTANTGFGAGQVPVFNSSGKLVFTGNVLEFDQTNELVFKQNAEAFSLKMASDKLTLKNTVSTNTVLEVDGDDLLVNGAQVCLQDGTNCPPAPTFINTAGPQLVVGYDGASRTTTSVASDGFTTFTSIGTNTGFNFVGGNVGIGSPTPLGVLSVSSATAASEDMLIVETAGVRSAELKTDASGHTSFNIRNSAGAAKVNLLSSGSSYLNGGNVGINNTNPQGRLHVNSDLRAAVFDPADGATWHDVVIQNPVNNLNVATGIAFELHANYHVNAGTGIAAVKSFASADYAADMAFITRPNASVASERMRITHDGKVGIGSASPDSRLDVAGALSSASAVEFGTKILPTITQSGTGGYTGLLVNVTETTTGSGAKKLLDLQVGGVSKFSVDKNGAVISSTSTSGTAANYTSSSGTQFTVGYDGSSYSTVNVDSLGFTTFNGNGVGKGFNFTGGNVGIGTAIPGETLDVTGSVRASTSVKTPLLSNTTDLSFTADSDANGSGALIFNTGTNERMRVLNTGLVGIGVTNPTYKLDVGGTTNNAHRTIAVNSTPVIFLPQQGTAVGELDASMAIGDGLRLSSNTAGSEGRYNTSVGLTSMANNTTGQTNTSMGARSLTNNTTGNSNVAMGYYSLYANSSGGANVAIGTFALGSNTTASNNVAMGYGALQSTTTGSENVAIGHQALRFGTTAMTYNIGIGSGALSNVTGSSNVAVGRAAGTFISGGGSVNTTGSNSVFIGTNAYPLADGETNQIVIGYAAVGNGSNTATIGNDSITKTILKGSVGIGTNSPTVGKVEIVSTAAADYPLWIIPHATQTSPMIAVRNFVNNGYTFELTPQARLKLSDPSNGGRNLHFNTTAAANPRIEGNAIGADYWTLGYGASNDMTIRSGGNIGIGTTAPSEKLHVVGNILASGTITPSDKRLKKNIKPLKGALQKINRLQAVTYDWKEPEKHGKARQIGVIAQEVKEAFPEAVTQVDDGFLAVSYSVLVSPLIAAVKELYGQLKALYARVTTSEKEIMAIKEQIKLSRRTPASLDQTQDLKLMKQEMDKLKTENARKDRELKQMKAYLCHKDPSAPMCH